MPERRKKKIRKILRVSRASPQGRLTIDLGSIIDADSLCDEHIPKIIVLKEKRDGFV